jgi:DNA repair exonuclease SbcCD ATPase subunit
MKLRALELEQFRKFDRPIRITGFTDALNLVVGPNEMGKSTLFAALRAVLLERHRSQAQAVKSLQPAGHEGAAPRVALDFEIDGRRYRIEKRFLRRPSAELRLPDGRRLHGEPAEETLEELLAGALTDGQTGARHVTADAHGVWSLLWVGQGQSFILPQLAPGARGALQAALDAEVGEILGGDHGNALIATLDQALQALVYKAGAPRGRYREAEDARKAVQLEVADLEARRDELERDLNDLDEARAHYERLSAERRAGREEAALSELTTRRDGLRVLRAELREAEADLKARRAGLDKTLAEQTRRQTLTATLAKLDAEFAQATVALTDATAGAATAEVLASEQTGKVERLQTTLDQASGHQRGLQRLAQAIRQRDAGGAALCAAASQVALEFEPAALERVRVDGRPLGEPSCSLRIVEPLAIAIEGVGRIVIRPVVPDRRRLQASVREAERQIGRELEVLGLRPPSPKARQLELGLTAAGAPAGASMRLGTTAVDPPSWPEAAVVETALAETERQIEGLVAELRSARRELDMAVEARHRQSAARAQAVAHLAQTERQLEQLRAELAAASQTADAADLAASIAELERQVGVAEQRLRQLQEQAPQESLEELEHHMAELRATVEQCAAAAREHELAVERLRERIQVVSGGGLDERLAGARRRLDELERECAKYRREVEALELLLRVLRDAEREAKARYVGPVLRRLRPGLQALFPGAELEIDSGFRITAVARAGAPEPFERLSDGTREQIAILARLAFAELLADQGRPAVVVLDDALVFSDDQRIEQMFDILARAGEKLQILILTCRERVFRGLPAHRLRIEAVDTPGAQ